MDHTDSPDHKSDFDQLRNRLLNDLLLAMSITSVPAVGLSLSRSVVLGFQPFMLVQAFLVILLWLIWFSRRRLSYLSRTTALLSILAITIFSGLTRLGPVADSKVFFVMFSFSAMLFLSARVAWGLILASIVGLALLGVAAVQNLLNFDLDYDVYSHHPLTWVTSLWTVGFFCTIMGYIGWRMVHGLKNQAAENQMLANRLQRISEHVPGMVYQYRLYPDGSSRIPYTSDAIRDLLRVTPEQVRDDATAAFAAIHPDDIEYVRRAIDESAKNLSTFHIEFRVAFPDGVTRWLYSNAVPQRENDGGVLWHGFINDVTERKKMEQLKDDFVSVVSHELRTPLTAIRGSIMLVNSGALDDNPDEKKSMLAIAGHNSDRLLFLINDLLDIEKLEHGSAKLDKTTFGVKEIIEQCIDENQPYAKQHETFIALRECDTGTITADVQRFKQIMANLLSNACKFNTPGLPVEIFVKRQNDHYLFQVKDHGTGIAEEFKPKVFDKFTQADSSSKRKTGGTGLGLAIVKKIVELHHGRIYFETRENFGTSFFVELPV